MSDFRATLVERLRDPRAIPILARHSIPVAGVFVFGWSTLETVAALVLDAVSILWLVGAIGSYFAAKDLDTGGGGLMNALYFWAGVLGVFVFVAAIRTRTREDGDGGRGRCIAVLAGISGALAIFGRYALHLLVIVAQAFGAVTEIMRDRYVASLMPTRTTRPRAKRKRRNSDG